MATPRQNDVALAIGGILLCTSVSTGLLATGVYAQPGIIAAQAEYLARTALMSAEELAAQQSQALMLTVVAATLAMVVVIVAVGVVYFRRSRMENTLEAARPAEPDKPKGPWATGASIWVGAGCIFGGVVISGITAFCIGAYVEQMNNAALIEPLSIAAGVTGGLALVCFALDFYLNNKEPAVTV